MDILPVRFSISIWISTKFIYSPQRRKERKGLIIFRKSALLFFAVLPVRRYFWWINGKE
jgi:hypothetical protein